MSSDVEEITPLTALTSVPKKRGKRARKVSGVIFLVTASLVLTFGFIRRNEDEFERASCSNKRNSTRECFKKKEILTFPNIFGTALSLFGVVLGTLVDRLSLIGEEYRHREQRYDGSWKKMFKACFSGIHWRPVFLLIMLAAITLSILIIVREKAGKPGFEIQHLVYILSGVGVGPLVMQLLNLNTQSEIHISSILEENETNIANVLAWHYYFNYLEKLLRVYKEAAHSANLGSSKCFL
ncbi:stimulator of interferon genes protein-like isoform X2 [Xenia sp. Carnegie-2017]|uniref:stimulator of interferon genes protein-like isoform X2 n=1 Tax=Xenia sp. Carnegie-2017 TaxID=2897299 RepID=UPI001F04A50E|nr:stimulator of interferon genes protein-like isoform X2 [Xenia sp. Carnegie-2017]